MWKKGLCIVLCLGLFACRTTQPEEVYEPFPTTVEVSSSYLVELDYETLMQMMNDNQDFILYIGRPDCGDCREFNPLLANYLNEKGQFQVYYLNVKQFRDAANQEGASAEQIDFYNNMREDLEFTWTPTLQHRQGWTVLSQYTYLSEAYYALSDDQEKEEAKNQAVTDFENWMEEEGLHADL